MATMGIVLAIRAIEAPIRIQAPGGHWGIEIDVCTTAIYSVYFSANAPVRMSAPECGRTGSKWNRASAPLTLGTPFSRMTFARGWLPFSCEAIA
jgi:hypothetical protein